MTPPTLPPAVRERPIIMTGESVRAILEGRKSQTRRTVHPQPAGAWAAPGKTGCPYGQPGDRLWVREKLERMDRAPDNPYPKIIYDATRTAMPIKAGMRCDGYCLAAVWPWKSTVLSPVRMPRWASRLTLEITELRVQRVQEITPADAMAEGALLEEDGWHNPDIWFSDLWDRLNAKRGYSWESNPWVWAITFKVVSND